MSTDTEDERLGRSRLVEILEAYRAELTWQQARELFVMAFPSDGATEVVVLKVP